MTIYVYFSCFIIKSNSEELLSTVVTLNNSNQKMAKYTPRPGLLPEEGTAAINLSKRICPLLMVILSKFSIYSHTSLTDLHTDAKNSIEQLSNCFTV